MSAPPEVLRTSGKRVNYVFECERAGTEDGGECCARTDLGRPAAHQSDPAAEGGRSAMDKTEPHNRRYNFSVYVTSLSLRTTH